MIETQLPGEKPLDVMLLRLLLLLFPTGVLSLSIWFSNPNVLSLTTVLATHKKLILTLGRQSLFYHLLFKHCVQLHYHGSSLNHADRFHIFAMQDNQSMLYFEHNRGKSRLIIIEPNVEKTCKAADIKDGTRYKLGISLGYLTIGVDPERMSGPTFFLNLIDTFASDVDHYKKITGALNVTDAVELPKCESRTKQNLMNTWRTHCPRSLSNYSTSWNRMGIRYWVIGLIGSISVAIVFEIVACYWVPQLE